MGVAFHRDFALADWAIQARTLYLLPNGKSANAPGHGLAKGRIGFRIWGRIRGGAGGEVESREPSACEMETMTASEASIWKRERIGCGKKALIPRAKRGSLAAAEEMVRRGMRKARSLENLETLTKALENLEMMEKSSKSPDRMFTDEDVKAWSKYLRMIRAQEKEASAPSVGEEEASAQEGLAEKTRMFDTTVMMEKNVSTALLAKSDKSNALRRVDEDGPGTILGVLIVDLLGMGGESKAEAARRQMEAALADKTAMGRLRAELRHQDESQRKQAEPEEEDLEMKRSDYEAWMAREYRRRWIAVYSANFGSFDDTSEFPIKHPLLCCI